MQLGSARGPGAWQRLVAWVCALIAVAVGGFAANAARLPGDHGVSSLVHIGDGDRLADFARAADPDFVLVPETSHYDGAYYYAIATDPLATGSAHTLIDEPAYRYGHAFYGQLAWVLSLGRRHAVPLALLALSLLGLGFAAFLASRIAVGLGWTPWSGLVVAVSPGLIYATTADCVETVAAALLGAALLAWQRRRLALAGVALVCLALTKEPLSLVSGGILLYEVVRLWRRDGQLVPRAWTRQRRRVVAALAALAAGPVVLVGWLLYVDHRFGAWPLGQNKDVHAPFKGIIDTLDQARALGLSNAAGAQLGAAAVPLVIVVFVALAIGLVAAIRLRTVLDGVYLATAPLIFLLGPANLLFPKDLLRLTVIPVLLLPAVLRGGRAARAESAAAAAAA